MTAVDARRSGLDRTAPDTRAEMELLFRLAGAMNRSQRVEDVYDPALDGVRELFGADRSSILLFDTDQVMRFRAWRGLSAAYRAAVEGHSPWSPDERDPQPILIPDTDRDETMAPYRQLFAAERIRAIGFVPLVEQGRLLGKFMMYWDRPRSFSARDASLGLTIAAFVAQAVARGRLLESERTAREAAEVAGKRARFLAEASRLLSVTPLNHGARLEQIAQLAVPEIADWCSVELVGDDATAKRLAVAHVDPAKVELARRLRERYPPDPQAPHGVPHVLRTGRPELHSEITDEVLVGMARDAEHLRIARELGLRSAMIVPISSREKTLGAITFVSDRPDRRYDPSDLEMAEDLGRRAGLALENAQLFEQEGRLREKLHVALDAGCMGVWEWDIPTSRVAWSPTLEALHGIAPGTFPGTFEAFERDIHPDDRDRVLTAIRATLETRRDHDLEYRIVRPDGEVRWVAAHGKLIVDAEQRPIGMTGVCMEATGRKRLEQAREEAVAELQRNLHINEMFTGILGHDLRNPLNAIITAARVALMSGGGEKLSKPLSLILRSGERMARMISQLLDFSRVRLGPGIPIQPEWGDLVPVLRQAIDELDCAHPDRAMRLEYSGNSEGEWDTDRLLQVFSNLIANAIQHGASEHELTVRFDGSAKDAIRVSVWNGGSISATAVPRLFEPLAGGVRRRDGSQGLGLGLFISQEIVRAHGGIIDVQSDDACGTTFTVTLPRSR